MPTRLLHDVSPPKIFWELIMHIQHYSLAHANISTVDFTSQATIPYSANTGG